MIKFYSFISFEILLLFTLVFINKKYWNSRLKSYQIALCLAFIFYLSIVIMAIINNLFWTIKLDAFDLNSDGIFSSNEKTLGQQMAFRNSVNQHTSMKNAVIFGPIYAFVYFLIIIAPLKIVNRRKKNLTEIN